MQARISQVRWEAESILSYSLEPIHGESFPTFTAGSHINLSLAPGLTRSYSLLNDPAELNRYEIAVQLNPASRGGSKHVHDNWRVGQLVQISAPSNNFSLDERSAHTVLIAGGIGITPMLSMIARLEELGQSWELHYAVRNRARAAFMRRLSQYESVHLAIDDEPGFLRLDIDAVIDSAPADAHFYCCGPEGMLSHFRQATSLLKGKAHFEYFSADTDIASSGGYKLELRRSGRSIEVQAGETMLDALLNAGINVGFACSEGICGSCKVSVLEGAPDHRDHFLSDQEKESNQAVMVCCSGARSPSLTLDL